MLYTTACTTVQAVKTASVANKLPTTVTYFIRFCTLIFAVLLAQTSVCSKYHTPKFRLGPHLVLDSTVIANRSSRQLPPSPPQAFITASPHMILLLPSVRASKMRSVPIFHPSLRDYKLVAHGSAIYLLPIFKKSAIFEKTFVI